MFQLAQKCQVLVQYILFQCVFMMPAFLGWLYQTGFHEYFDVM